MINLAGGIGQNKSLYLHAGRAVGGSIPVFSNSEVSSASKNAWMGWEVLNANEEVDIRDLSGFTSFEKLPIGNYVEDMAHQKKQNKTKTKIEKETVSEEENKRYWEQREKMYDDAKSI